MRTVRLSLIAAAVVALPLGLGSPAVGQSEEPLDPMGASYWTGTWAEGQGGAAPGSETSMAGYTEVLGTAFGGEVTADDPRIAGTISDVRNLHRAVSREPGEGDVGISSGSVRIDNDQGAWVGTVTTFGGPSGLNESYVLVGEGAYEGLTAVFHWHGADNSFEGVILPAALPATPDPIAPPVE